MDQIEKSQNGHNVSAVDAALERRPGVPAQRAPEVVGSAHWVVPEKQTPNDAVTRDATRDSLTATFGTGQPPRGLSGMVRRAAYKIPDYEAKRWAMLLLADRVDAMEGRLLRMASNPLTWIAAAGAVALLLSSRSSRRRSWSFGR